MSAQNKATTPDSKRCFCSGRGFDAGHVEGSPGCKWTKPESAPITAEELVEVERLHREATQGKPWKDRTWGDAMEECDERYVRQACTLLPRLAAEVRRLREEESDVEDLHDAQHVAAESAAAIIAERTAERDALASKVESLIARCDALEGLVETMIREADAHRDGVKTDRSSTAALASERLWAAANEAREALKKARR